MVISGCTAHIDAHLMLPGSADELDLTRLSFQQGASSVSGMSPELEMESEQHNGEDFAAGTSSQLLHWKHGTFGTSLARV